MARKKIKKLFEPIKIGNLELKNRIKMPAMAVAMGKDGGISEQIKSFYAERAKGGVGYIGISCTATRLIQDPMQGIYDDKFIPSLRELAEVIHANGAKIFAQAGTGYSWAFGDGPVEVVSPSGINISGKAKLSFRLGGPFEPKMPRALSVDEIHQIADAYGDGASRVKQAGFDAFEIIASVGYIVSAFMSPRTNKRTDEYAGSLENRIRFLLEIIENIQKKCGEDYPITCRVSGADFLEPKGYDLEDTKAMARILEENGVSQIDVMAGWHDASVEMVQIQVPQGSWVYLAEGVKSAVNIPVAAGTQIQDIVLAERVVSEGKADMVYMARALIADPELPNKAREGRLKDIRPCMNCCRCMEAADKPPVYCTVNARVGREEEYPYEKPVSKRKKVLVVGGGPSGMEAARIATLRGHSVTLCEKNSRLGGALLIASITNLRLGAVLNYFKRQMKLLPIEVKLNTDVTPEMIRKMNPDVVVLAAGGAPPPLNVPGAGKGILLERSDVNDTMGRRPMKKGGPVYRIMSFFGALLVGFYYNPDLLRWLMKFNFPFKKRILIVGGDYPGCELGECLGYLGKKVTIIEEFNRIGNDIGIIHRWTFIKHLREQGAILLTNAKILEITDKGAKIDHQGSTEFIEADTIVKVGITKNEELAQAFKGKIDFRLVGDCTDPALLIEAVSSGFIVGQKI